LLIYFSADKKRYGKFSLFCILSLSYTGVATAFAARDVLGNVFSGLSMQFSKPFSIGDTIKVC